MLLSESDHDRIKAAVDEAETRTSGEIVSVLARECSEYWEAPLVWAAIVSLVLPLAGLLAFGPQISTFLNGGWIDANGGSEVAIGRALIAYGVLQGMLFVVTALVVSIPAVRRLLTPTALKRERVHRRALEQFMTRAYHLTEHDTGVLIFASLAERQAIVLADDGVASKVEPAEWKSVVEALTQGMKANDPGDGFVRAIGRAADLLAAHCPRQPGDHTQLPDTVIELEF